MTEQAERILLTERADAWFEYGEACGSARAASPSRYDEVEPWAWNRLQARLRTVDARRRALEKPGRMVTA